MVFSVPANEVDPPKSKVLFPSVIKEFYQVLDQLSCQIEEGLHRFLVLR
jgi:hypothetical protein